MAGPEGADDGAVPVELGGRRPAPDAFCRWCGAPDGGCDGVACRHELDPPRFCPTCGRRLRVVVIPTGHRATCRDHGEVTDPPA